MSANADLPTILIEFEANGRSCPLAINVQINFPAYANQKHTLPMLVFLQNHSRACRDVQFEPLLVVVYIKRVEIGHVGH